MTINMNRCLFHSIAPLNYNYNKNQPSLTEARGKRLQAFLDTGYLLPGKDIPESYSSSEFVYFALTYKSEIKNANATFDWDFSAWEHHIVGNPALVFDERILTLGPLGTNHGLSEEVTIQSKIPIQNMIAITMPTETPLDIIRRYQELFQLSPVEKEINDILGIYESTKNQLTETIQNILTNPTKAITDSYEEIMYYQSILKNNNIDVPFIRHNGIIYSQEEDLKTIQAEKESIKILMKK